MEVNYTNTKPIFMTNEQREVSMEASRSALIKEIRKLFHICLNEKEDIESIQSARHEVEIDTVFGKLRLKTRPASPNLVHIVYLNGGRVYKILTQDMVGVGDEVLDAFLDERLQRPSFHERVHLALSKPLC